MGPEVEIIKRLESIQLEVEYFAAACSVPWRRGHVHTKVGGSPHQVVVGSASAPIERRTPGGMIDWSMALSSEWGGTGAKSCSAKLTSTLPL